MDDARDRELGRRIAALRAARGWSQGWLASRTGMTQSVLSRVESGKREARASELAELARALGVGPETLLEGAGEAEPVRPPASPLADATAARAALPDALATQAAPAPGAFAARLEQEALHAAFRAPFDLAETAPSDASTVLDTEQEPSRSRDAGATHSRAARAYRRAVDDSDFMLERRARVREAWDGDEAERSMVRQMRQDILPSPSADPPRGDVSARAAWAGATTLPRPVAQVVADYFRLRAVTDAEVLRNASWETVDAYGRRRAGKPSGLVAGRPAATVNWNEPRDRYARLWRHELGIGVDGPVPDLVALLEDTGVAEVVVARLGTDEPVCAAVTVPDPAPDDAVLPPGAAREWHGEVSFLFVNAQRPVTLQRHALAHAFAHLVLGHGDVVDRRIEWSRAAPLETEANDFAEEFLAPAAAVARWYDRHGDPRPSVDVLLDLAAAFGITFWAALYRSRACGRLAEKPQARLSQDLRARQWELLPEQRLRGGLRDTLSTLSDEAPLPPAGAIGVGGVRPRLTRDAAAAGAFAPAVLHVPSRLRVWSIQALRSGLLSLEQSAAAQHRPPTDLAAELERLGIE